MEERRGQHRISYRSRRNQTQKYKSSAQHILFSFSFLLFCPISFVFGNYSGQPFFFFLFSGGKREINELCYIVRVMRNEVIGTFLLLMACMRDRGLVRQNDTLSGSDEGITRENEIRYSRQSRQLELPLSFSLPPFFSIYTLPLAHPSNSPNK